jgi:hypothetical protein
MTFKAELLRFMKTIHRSEHLNITEIMALQTHRFGNALPRQMKILAESRFFMRFA